MHDHGKIDSEDFAANEAELLAKLKRIIADEKALEDLNASELDILRKMIGMYRSYEAFGRFAGGFRNVILFVGGLLVAWFTLVDNFSSLWTKMFGG